MLHFYLESSAVVKLYVAEAGSGWVRQLAADREAVLYTSDLTIAEVAAAIAILYRTKRIKRRQQREAIAEFYRDTTTRFLHLSVTREIVREAADLTQRYPLKSYDAVHLATALSLLRDLNARDFSLSLVTGDDQIIRTALAEQLPTANPFDYTHLDPSGIT